MEGVGRNEILNWINDLLQLDYKKIEQMGSGAALCQLIDVIHPGKINLKMVNFNAKYDYEFIKNFSYLQESFAKLGVEKYVEVAELVKSRPQANLEFCQWMKKYFDQYYSGEPYNAAERRVQLKISTDRDRVLVKGKSPSGVVPPSSKPTAKPVPTTTTTKPVPTTTTTTKPAPSSVKPTTTTTTKPTTTSVKPAPSSTISKPVSKPKPTSVSTPPSTPKPTTTTTTAPSSSTGKPTISQPSFKPTPKSISPQPPATESSTVITKTVIVQEPPTELLEELEQQKKLIEEQRKELEDQKLQIAELTERITNLEITNADVEKDRDFYFERLRKSEIFCQEHDNEPLLNEVLRILYNTDEEVEGEQQQQQDEGQQGEEEDEEIQEEGDHHETENLSEPEPEQEHEEEEIHEEVVREEEVYEEEQEVHEEEQVDGLNEEEIMNQVLQEGDNEDEILDSTFDGDEELLLDEPTEY